MDRSRALMSVLAVTFAVDRGDSAGWFGVTAGTITSAPVTSGVVTAPGDPASTAAPTTTTIREDPNGTPSTTRASLFVHDLLVDRPTIENGSHVGPARGAQRQLRLLVRPAHPPRDRQRAQHCNIEDPTGDLCP